MVIRSRPGLLLFVALGLAAALLTAPPSTADLLGDAQSPQRALKKKPKVSVEDATATETDAGTQFLVFKVKLSKRPKRPVTVNYETAEATATSPSDFGGARGAVTFTGRRLVKKIYVPVHGDLLRETAESFVLKLTKVRGPARLADGTATALVLDDDPVTINSLTVLRNGPSLYGNVTIEPGGTVCTSATTSCVRDFASDQTVTLTANPNNSETQFGGWAGDCVDSPGLVCTLRMDEDRVVVVTFTDE